MERDTFVFYKDWMEAIRGLPDDVRLDVYESVIEYATTGSIRGLKPMASIAFNFIKTTIDRDVQSYVDKCERNRENGTKGAEYGKLGGRPRNPEKPRKTPDGVLETPKNPEKPIDNDSDSDSDPDNEKTIPPIPPPSMEDVVKYFDLRGYTEEAAMKFHMYYDENGWNDKDGNPVKSWKHKAISVWFRDEHRKPKQTNKFGIAL